MSGLVANVDTALAHPYNFFGDQRGHQGFKILPVHADIVIINKGDIAASRLFNTPLHRVKPGRLAFYGTIFQSMIG